MQVRIDKINSQGNGVGIHNGKKVFVEKTAVGDVVETEIIKENKDFIVAEVKNIIAKSNDRTIPKCPFYDKCGGCNLLHLSEQAYYDFKINIALEAAKHAGFNPDNITLIKVGDGTRRRASFKVINGKIGFFEKNSNRIVEINSCLLLTKEINNILPKIQELIKKITTITEFSITSYKNGLEILFTLNKAISMQENNILGEFIEKNDSLIVLSYRINAEESFLLLQKSPPELTFLNGITIKLMPNIFLQATEKGQNSITEIVVSNLKNDKNILDLYCGIGTYTFPLSNNSKVHSIEGNQTMVDILNQNAKSNGLAHRITAECRNLVARPLLAEELNKYDGIVINPPRNGAKAQCEFIAKSHVKHVVMVSCNPQTFSIDAAELKNGGYRLKSFFAVDQFFRTQHLEVVGVFEK